MNKHSRINQKTFQTPNKDIYAKKCELSKPGDWSWGGIVVSPFVNFGFLNVNFKLPF